MKINNYNINLVHDKSFVVNRPNGISDNCFIYTRTPFLLLTDGKMKRYPQETTVFFRKGHPQHFMAAGYVYANDYMNFEANDEEMEFIDSLGIPSGVGFTNLDSSIFLNIHRYLCIEQQSHTSHKQESIDLLLRYFLIKLAQAIEEVSQLSISSSTKSAIQELHSEIHANAGKNYTVEMMAKRVGVSPSYFQTIYKKIVGYSCLEDVINARIYLAKTLLTSTEIPITEVAHRCGYENISHFSRQFKKHTSLTASEYRKSVIFNGDPLQPYDDEHRENSNNQQYPD